MGDVGRIIGSAFGAGDNNRAAEEAAKQRRAARRRQKRQALIADAQARNSGSENDLDVRFGDAEIGKDKKKSKGKKKNSNQGSTKKSSSKTGVQS